MASLKFDLGGVRRLAAAARVGTERPGFWLRRDRGVYLLGSTDPDGADPVYAEGLGPRADDDLVSQLVGPRDFRTFVPLHWADEALRTLGATHLVLALNGGTVTLRPPQTGRPG